MTAANAMRLKLILKDDPLLRRDLCRCESPDQVIAICKKLQLKIDMQDLLRLEAIMTLTLDDEQLMQWFTTPYWQRVLVSIGAMDQDEAAMASQAEE